MPKDINSAFQVIVQALAEKYNVTISDVVEIFKGVSTQTLLKADWKDLDAIVQEGLVDIGMSDKVFGAEEDEEIELGGNPYE